MSDEEPPPITSSSSLPSTSTCPISVTCDPELDDATCSSSALSSTISSFLTLDFDKLSLDSDLCEGRYDQNHSSPGPQSPLRSTQSMQPPTGNAQFYRIPNRKYGRFTPYDVPFKLRRRRKAVISTANPTSMEILLKIKLKGNVEPLRMCIFDKENLLPTPCSVQAARPPSPNETEEVDELSEYFTHFVRVELKMSSLAESMYV